MVQPGTIEIAQQLEGATLALRLEGRLDSNTADELTLALEAHDIAALEALVLDMEGVDFISSKGIRVLVAAKKQLSEGAPLRILNANNAVREVLRLSGLEKVFDIV